MLKSLVHFPPSSLPPSLLNLFFIRLSRQQTSFSLLTTYTAPLPVATVAFHSEHPTAHAKPRRGARRRVYVCAAFLLVYLRVLPLASPTQESRAWHAKVHIPSVFHVQRRS